MPTIISIVGRSQSGKTTLIEKLIPELKNRGYRIGTIKHTHHEFNIDKSGKDSSRHKDAGAETVILASPGKIAMIKNDHQGTLDSLLNYFEDMDLVITEGYKMENRPKIEVLRAAVPGDLFCRQDPHLIAVVTDRNLNVDVPIFGLEEIKNIADFIEEKYMQAV